MSAMRRRARHSGDSQHIELKGAPHQVSPPLTTRLAPSRCPARRRESRRPPDRRSWDPDLTVGWHDLRPPRRPRPEHRDISTTQRYMHLSPAAVVDAIRLLDRPSLAQDLGAIGESEGPRFKSERRLHHINNM